MRTEFLLGLAFLYIVYTIFPPAGISLAAGIVTGLIIGHLISHLLGIITLVAVSCLTCYVLQRR